MAFDDPISRRRFLGGVAASAAYGWVHAGAGPAESASVPKATDELTRLGEYRLYVALSPHRKVYAGKTVEQGSIVTARI